MVETKPISQARENASEVKLRKSVKRFVARLKTKTGNAKCGECVSYFPSYCREFALAVHIPEAVACAEFKRK